MSGSGSADVQDDLALDSTLFVPEAPGAQMNAVLKHSYVCLDAESFNGSCHRDCSRLARLQAASFAGSETGALVVSGLLNGISVLLVADLLWQLPKSLFPYCICPCAGRRGQRRCLGLSRSTSHALAIFRNTLAAFIASLYPPFAPGSACNRALMPRWHLRRRDRLRLTNPGQGRTQRRLRGREPSKSVSNLCVHSSTPAFADPSTKTSQ
jgi:hypothetical protein